MLAPGQRFANHTLARELGRGAMGVVFAARDERLGREVAIKVMLNSSANATLGRRFQTEAHTAARVRHPNVVRVHTAGVEEGRPYLVMDLVEGSSLESALATGPLASIPAARLALELAGALAAAHAVGVLHRDLKPANVVMTEAGVPMLTDFGLSRDLADERTRLTLSGQLLGTPAYMAPEQAAGKRQQVDERTDVFGFGATLYAILTGRPPAEGETLHALLASVVRERPAPPSTLVASVNADLEAVCLKCLEKVPEDRYASAAELVADLERLHAGEPIRARPAGAARLIARRLRKSMGLLGAGLALALVAAGMAMYLVVLPKVNARDYLADHREWEQKVLVPYALGVWEDGRYACPDAELTERELRLVRALEWTTDDSNALAFLRATQAAVRRSTRRTKPTLEVETLERFPAPLAALWWLKTEAETNPRAFLIATCPPAWEGKASLEQELVAYYRKDLLVMHYRELARGRTKPQSSTPLGTLPELRIAKQEVLTALEYLFSVDRFSHYQDLSEIARSSPSAVLLDPAEQRVLAESLVASIRLLQFLDASPRLGHSARVASWLKRLSASLDLLVAIKASEDRRRGATAPNDAMTPIDEALGAEFFKLDGLLLSVEGPRFLRRLNYPSGLYEHTLRSLHDRRTALLLLRLGHTLPASYDVRKIAAGLDLSAHGDSQLHRTLVLIKEVPTAARDWQRAEASRALLGLAHLLSEPSADMPPRSFTQLIRIVLSRLPRSFSKADRTKAGKVLVEGLAKHIVPSDRLGMNASIFASSMVSVLDELEVLQEFASQVVRAFGVRLTSKPFGLVLESLFSRLPGSPVLHRFLLTATATGTGDREGRLRSVALLCAFKARAGQAREGWAVLEPFSKSKRTAGELATLLPSAVLLTLAETAKIWDRPWARELVEAVLRSSRVSPSEKRKFESLLP